MEYNNSGNTLYTFLFAILGLAIIVFTGFIVYALISEPKDDNTISVSSQELDTTVPPRSNSSSELLEALSQNNRLIIIRDLFAKSSYAQSDEEYTLFAPSDDSLATLFDRPQSTEEIDNFVGAHLVQGQYDSEQIISLNGQNLTALNGDLLKISVENDEVIIINTKSESQMTVSVPDIKTLNGIFHVTIGFVFPSIQENP